MEPSAGKKPSVARGGFPLRSRWFLVGALTVLPFASPVIQAQEIRVAAAADLRFGMQELAGQFEKRAGTAVKITYGSSGNFYSQLQSGAPFDVFFSADVDYPKQLAAAGAGEPGTLCIYAIGRIAIWMPISAKPDLARKGWDALLDPSVQRIAIANPEHAPYGRAAVAALQKAGIYERIKTELVFGENISQAAQFVQSGNAQAGILAMSLAVSPAMKDGKLWEVPSNLYPPIEQAAIVMKNARNKESAKSLLNFVKSPTGREILLKNGFGLPDSGAIGTLKP